MLETAPEAPKLFTKRAMDLDYLSGVLQAKMADSDILGQGILYRQDDSLVLSLPGDLLFDPGQARLHANTHEAMVSLGTTLKLVGNSLEIIGHAEATPPPSDSPYSSNWDLSLARALALANALHAVGYADMIKALGAADGGAREISEKLPEAQRQSLSRRVDLVIREASLEGAGNGQ